MSLVTNDVSVDKGTYQPTHSRFAALQQHPLSRWNHFPNTMFGGVLLWTLIEVLLRNMRGLYAFWRQKTPLTNGQVQEAKTPCCKFGEAWLRLGWKSTPWVHWTVVHCAAVLQKSRNLYVLSVIPAEHKHKPFKLAVNNSMRGWCLLGPRVSRRGLTHVLNMETLDVGLRHRSKGLPLERPQGSEEKRTTCALEKPNLNPVDAFGALLAKILGAETPPQKGWRKGVPAHKGCAEKVQKGCSSAERGLHKGRPKGAKRVQKGC